MNVCFSIKHKLMLLCIYFKHLLYCSRISN